MALVTMIRTARVYNQSTRLYDPKSGREWPTLAPIGEDAPIGS
jgi:hypothetical protein